MQTMETPVQIGVVERNTFDREIIVCALKSQPDFRVVFDVATVNEVPPNGTPPHVMLFSAWYPSEIFGEELSIAYWRIRMPHTSFVLLTANKLRAVIEALADQGLEGYAIRQTINLQALFAIIRGVASRQKVFCQASQEILSERKTGKELTRREIQIIRLLNQEGTRNRKHVANALGVSNITINQHLKNIFEKLEVSGVTEMMECGRVMSIFKPK